MVWAMRHQTGWQRDLEDTNYSRDKALAFLNRNLVIPTHRMCSPFRSRGRESSRELERGNSVKKLAYNNPRGSRCPGTRTDLLLFTFLLRGRRGLRRCFPRVLSSWDTPGGASDSTTSTRASSGMNAFTSSRAGTRNRVVSYDRKYPLNNIISFIFYIITNFLLLNSCCLLL